LSGRRLPDPDQHLAVHDAKLGIRLDAPEYSFDQEITTLIFIEAGSAHSSLQRGVLALFECHHGALSYPFS